MFTRIRQLHSDTRGMTLVETMVALVIIVLAATVLVTCVMTGAKLVRRGTDIQKGSDLASDEIEKSTSSSAGTSTLTFEVNGQTCTVSGEIVTKTGEYGSGSFTFSEFVPNEGGDAS